MASNRCFMIFLYLFALLQTPIQVTSISITYCSSTNTGSSFDAVVSTFQSNGACRETCVGQYAFAILQGTSCWCSNVAPGDTTSIGSCDDSCPGYPADKCGNAGSGLYGYIQLDRKPSATAGGSTSPTVASSIATAPTTGSPTTSKSTVSVQTVSGQVVTITVSNQPTSAGSAKKKNSLSPGAIAGVIIGSLIALGVGLALIMWCCCIRPRRTRAYANDDFHNIHYDEPAVPDPTFQGTFQSRSPQMATANSGPMNDPVAFSRPSRHPRNPNRLSVPAFTDNRMKKDFLIYPNGSRHSNVSLQDHHDYSRPVLRLTNPDPPNA